MPELIEALDLKRATVTLDAMGCQKAIAQALVDKRADYVFGLKGNQETLHEQVKRLFDVTQCENYQDFAGWGHATQEAGHDRIEMRRCVALACPSSDAYAAWAGMRSVAMVESMRQTAQDVTVEKRYYISSLAPDSQPLAHAIRSHWEVEDRLHWCLDVTFHEDGACQIFCVQEVMR